MVKHKLRNFNLVRVDSVKQILHTRQVLDLLLHLRRSEREEPPALQLRCRRGREGGMTEASSLSSHPPSPAAEVQGREGGVTEASSLQWGGQYLQPPVWVDDVESF